MKRLLLILTALLIMLTTSGGGNRPEGWPLVAPTEKADIVVYGSGLAGCAAAWKASASAPDKQVVLVVPYPENQYGGLATAGSQNFWDLRYWRKDNTLVQGGSFAHWLKAVGPFYNPDDLAEQIASDLGELENLQTYWAMDITALKKGEDGRLKAMALRSIKRDYTGTVVWGETRKVVKADIFIDASEDGRLSRLADVGLTVGREDWPKEFLKEDYINKDYKGSVLLPRQQAATLMFKVKGLKPGTYPDMYFHQKQGVWGAYGGKDAYINDPVVKGFNDKYGSKGFALKPLNAAQNGPNSEEWWINTLLIFNVDGRANARDMYHDTYPQNVAPYALNTDTAWQKAREMLNNPDFIKALRRFDGFSEVELVRDKEGQPVTGSILYLRETVHTVLEPEKAGPGTDDNNYAITTTETYRAGKNNPGTNKARAYEDVTYKAGNSKIGNSKAGTHKAGNNNAESGLAMDADHQNYVNRIGLGFYWQDINACRFEDLKGEDGSYHWPVTPLLRPDFPRTIPGKNSLPQNPVYLPFNSLLSRSVPNLLIPGYATGCSSMAWAELRVLPNQCVAGDAAGVAAAYALETGKDPYNFNRADIKSIRNTLVNEYGARVDK
ncbi:MAG: hypothetical protein PWP31_1453 [Clostridia bacterium]|nr:hypothetical protein [Clostridia bacterium]